MILSRTEVLAKHLPQESDEEFARLEAIINDCLFRQYPEHREVHIGLGCYLNSSGRIRLAQRCRDKGWTVRYEEYYKGETVIILS